MAGSAVEFGQQDLHRLFDLLIAPGGFEGRVVVNDEIGVEVLVLEQVAPVVDVSDLRNSEDQAPILEPLPPDRRGWSA